MTNLFPPPELPISKKGDKLKGNEAYVLFQSLAGYLWNAWQSSLAKKGIFPGELWGLLQNKFSNEVESWASGELEWRVLIKSVINRIESDERDYNFTFEVFPKAIFGLPDCSKLVVPSNMKVAFDSIEFGSFEVTKHGTPPIYRKDEEKISINSTYQNLKINFEDNFIRINISSKSREEAMKAVFEFVDNFVHVFTLTSGFTISFKFISGWDEFSRPLPKPGRIEFGFTSYNLPKLEDRIIESVEIVSNWDKTLHKSLEYFNHAKFLNDIRIELFMKSDEKQRFLLSDIILNLYKSITSIIGDPAKESKEYQKRYKKYDIDYDFWKSDIDRLREIRNNWGVAHYYISEEKMKKLDREINRAFNTTRKTILKYVIYLKSQKRCK